jgi:hypothetical protein
MVSLRFTLVRGRVGDGIYIYRCINKIKVVKAVKENNRGVGVLEEVGDMAVGNRFRENKRFGEGLWL